MNYNPDRLRLGNKVLRQRLRGPALAAWYPRKTVSFRDLQDTYKPLGLTTFDEFEDDREEAIQMYAYAPDTRPLSVSDDHMLIAIVFAVRKPVVKVDQRRRGRLKVRCYGFGILSIPVPSRSCTPYMCPLLTPILESRSAKKKK